MSRRRFWCCYAWLFTYGLLFGQQSTETTPRQAARAIVARVRNETAFALRDVPQKPVLDIQVLDFGAAFGSGRQGIAYALSSIHVAKDTTLCFGLSRDLPLSISINGSTLYTFPAKRNLVFKEIAYERFMFGDTLRFPLRRGENSILIKALLCADRNVVYIREQMARGEKAATRFDAASIDLSLKGAAWAYLGAFAGRSASGLSLPLPADSGFRQHYSYGGADFSWQSSPEHVLKTIVIPSNATFRRESYAEWQYPNGTVMLGILAYADMAEDSSALAFVQHFCRFTLENAGALRNQYVRLNAFRGSDHKLFRRSMLDDTGAPALPFVEISLRTHQHDDDSLVADIARYVFSEQLRLPDGTLCRYEPARGTIWADDLFMSVPFLLRMGRLTGDRKYYDDAARQALSFNKYLRDAKTGLYHHGFYGDTKKPSEVYWGRANGWVVWATTELLQYLPAAHPLREEILRNFRQHMKALVSVQSPTGLWHQVLDRPDSYEETSCTAMFLIGLARGIRSGELDKTYLPSLMRAWQGLHSRISSDGIVKDICQGTDLSNDLSFYLTRERFENDPRGLGAVITACVEMMDFKEDGVRVR